MKKAMQEAEVFSMAKIKITNSDSPHERNT